MRNEAKDILCQFLCSPFFQGWLYLVTVFDFWLTPSMSLTEWNPQWNLNSSLSQTCVLFDWYMGDQLCDLGLLYFFPGGGSIQIIRCSNKEEYCLHWQSTASRSCPGVLNKTLRPLRSGRGLRLILWNNRSQKEWRTVEGESSRFSLLLWEEKDFMMPLVITC